MKMQPKLIASAITVALLAGAVHAAENAGGGQPTSTPTHTVPVKPIVTNPGQRPDPKPPCPPGWQWVPKLKTCTKPTEIRHDLNDPKL
jgi:hypothetical protein